MNYTVLGISFLRSSLIVIVSLAAAMFIVRYFRSCNNRVPLFFQILLILCFFIPSIAVGYGYSYFTFLYIQNPFACNLIYSGVMICRLTPPAILVFYFIPPTISESALHCFRMNLKNRKKISASISYCRFMIHSSGKSFIAAAALLFLLVFTEFELASLMNISSWPVEVFDSHAHGLPVIDSLRLCLLPTFIECCAILIFLTLANSEHVKHSLNTYNTKKCTPKARLTAMILIFIGISGAIIMPMVMILRYAIPGMPLLFREFWMIEEILYSAIFAITGSLTAWICSSQLIKLYSSMTKWKKNLSILILIPGLLGSLPLALLILKLFQIRNLNFLYNTPIPLIIALALFLLAYTFIIMLILKTITHGESVHIAAITAAAPQTKQSGKDLLWELVYKGKFWLFFLILCRGFFDLTISGILAPTGMPTVTTRLYNLMHYGESEKLSATILLTITLPLILVFFLRQIVKKAVVR